MASKIIRVTSTPTLDIVVEDRGRVRIQPGGPGLYAAAAANVLDLDITIIGEPGYCSMAAVEVERRLEARRLSQPTSRRGAVFVLDYRGEERTFTVASRPPPLPLKPLPHILSPLYGEAPPGLPVGGMLAVDAQGYARSGVPLPAAQIYHYSRGELRLPPRRGLAVETNGPGPMRLFYRGSLVCSRLPSARLAGDSTGAGDAFTLAYYYLVAREGMDWCDALVEASRVVPEALSTAREAMAAVEPGPCPVDCSTRVVILDFDGTVVDTMEAYADAAAKIIMTLTGLGYEEAVREYLKTRGMAFPDQLRLLGVPLAEALKASRVFEAKKARILATTRPDPVVVEAIRTMRSLGVRVVLSTNNECSVVRGIPWVRDLFDNVLCYSPTSSKGPSHLWRVLNSYGVEPCQTLFVGDGNYDIEVYSGLGVPTVKTSGLWLREEAERLLDLLAEGGPLGELLNILV